MTERPEEISSGEQPDFIQAMSHSPTCRCEMCEAYFPRGRMTLDESEEVRQWIDGHNEDRDQAQAERLLNAAYA